MRLRSRLVLLVLAIALPGASASLWIIKRTYEGEQETLVHSLRETTRALSLVVERELDKRETIARLLADSPYLDGAPNLSAANRAAFYAQAQRAGAGLGGWIALQSRDEQLLNTSIPLEQAMPQRRPDQAAVDEFAASAPKLRGLAVGRLSNRLAASMQVPVVRDGVAVWNVGYRIVPDDLQALITMQNLPSGWIATIVDDNGRVVARVPDPKRWVGTAARLDFQQRVEASDEGRFDTVSLEGTPSVAFFSKSSRYGWTFAIAVPQSTYGRDLSKSMLEVSLGSLVLLVLALAAAVAVARRISEPIYSLQAAAHRVERGEVVEPSATGLKEADDVGAALAQASVTIARARIDLEEKVASAMALTRDAQKQLAQSQRLEALGQLTGGVAHDVNNLLAVIDNSAYVIERRPPGADSSTLWSAIARAIDVGRRLTGHLLRFGRSNLVKPELITLHTFLPGLAEIMRTALGARIAVSMRVEPSTHNLECDATEFELALINLAVNARDAMPKGGEFVVVARNATADEAAGLEAGPYVVVAVSDTGCGIADDIRDRVFDPFFTTKELGRGTGLGLSQVYGFCKQAGGNARIFATSSVGTTIMMVLPAGGESPADAAPGAAVSDTVSAPRHRELLLVEDNADLGEATETLLSLFGYAVTRASSAEEAIEMIDAGIKRFDVVLSDVVMPGGMNGISFAKYLKENVPDLPIILITGYAARLQEGHDFEVLRKPCAPEVLVAALRRVQQAAAQAHGDSAFGSLLPHVPSAD